MISSCAYVSALTPDCKPANPVSWLNQPMASLKERLEEVMDAMKWAHGDLVRVAGVSSSVVSQWLGKGSKEIKSIGATVAAERIEVASGFAALWVAKGLGPKMAQPQPPNVPGLAPAGPAVVAASSSAVEERLSPDVRNRINSLAPERLWALENVVRAFLGAEPVQVTPLQKLIQSLGVLLAQLPEATDEEKADKRQRVTICRTIALQGPAVLPALARGLPGAAATPAETRRASASARQGS